MTFVVKNELKIDQELVRFIVEEALPGTGVDADGFFVALSAIVHDLAPRNRALLRQARRLQAQIDAWHLANGGPGDPPPTRPSCRDRLSRARGPEPSA